MTEITMRVQETEQQVTMSFNERMGDSSGTSDYEQLTNKPSINDVELSGDLSAEDLSLADAEHTHDDRYYTETEVDTKLSGKSDTTHTHTQYAEKSSTYTKTAVDEALASKSDATHTHDDRYYTETEVDTKLSDKSDVSHTHTQYAEKSYTYTRTETDTALASKSDTTHTHDDRYYTETEVDTKLSAKQDVLAAGAGISIIDGVISCTYEDADEVMY